ncbi:nuclear transport factor 2 family protein [Mycobacterium sp. 663a-19]|uniref:nuclear transport factor 2 family protein n=1 Tax=Mycobacterium sp. 663a-19 TaxID=2986148 RepID=UPI002D1F5D28|nr:nuclear transport factor 2 family protein [Mycobacterium sp. 663a-19]MEB3980657.1 nuclear transport factor 2 family protein [Mycobacterium sp. 663a-19]
MLAETQITNLLYRYAECIDAGDLEAAAELFAHARIRVGAEETVDAAQLLDIWKSLIVLHADGTPRTKHVTTNPIVEVDEEAGTASCRSYYTVLQQTDPAAPQTIVTGRYHDRFERVDGRWRFCYRDLTLIDMVGDVSRHLAHPIAPAPGSSPRA